MLLTYAAVLLCLQLHTVRSSYTAHASNPCCCLAVPTAAHSRISIFVALGRFSFRSLSYLSFYKFVWFEVNTTLLIKIRLIECDTKLNGDLLPMFQRGMLPPSSGQLTKRNQSSQATYSSLTMKAEVWRSFKTSVLYLSINCVMSQPWGHSTT